MADCFEIINPKTNEPVPLNQIDEEICNLIGAPVHERRYGGSGENAWNWFDSIGWDMSQRRSYAEMREKYTKEIDFYGEYLIRIIKIINYLEENYTFRAFYGR